MKLKIQSKFLLSFLLIIILTSISQIAGYFVIERYIESNTALLQKEKAHNGANQIQSFINQIMLDLLAIEREYVGLNIESQGDASETLINVVNYSLGQNRYLKKITILSTNNYEELEIDRYAGQTMADELNYAISTDSFELALKGQNAFSKVYYLENDQVPHMDLYYPITYINKVIGVIKAQISLARLWDLIAEIKIGESGYVYVVDDEGRLLAHPNEEYSLSAVNLTSRPIVQQLLSNSRELSEEERIYQNENGVEVIGNGEKIPSLGWGVILEQPLSEAYFYLYTYRNFFFGSLVVSFIVLMFITFLISDRITASIRELQDTAMALSAGNYMKRANVNTGDEIGTLAVSFNKMLDDLSEKIHLLEQQKHELDQKTTQLILREDELHEKNIQLEKEHVQALGERNKLEVVLQGINDAVIAVDMDRLVTIFNSAAEKITGYPASEVMGRPIEHIINLFDKENNLIPPEEYCLIRRDDFEGVIYANRRVHLFGNKQSVMVDMITGKIAESEKVNMGCIITLHDISREIELDKMKLDFVSIAAHELRTPLTSIRGYLELLKQETINLLNNSQAKILNRVEIATVQLTGLMENLLSVAKIERGTYTLSLEKTNWIRLVSSRIEEFMPQIEDRELELVWNPPPEDEIPLVDIDPLRITEVLNNLLSNAIRYTQHGKVEVVVEHRPDRNEVVTHIADTGQGIPPDALPHMFEKFFRVSGVLEQGSKGTGLGLYIAKSIIDLHGGEIWVESQGKDRGATFSFSLPVASGAEEK